MVTIIGITGNKFNGKSIVAEYLCKNYGFMEFSFAHPLKEACKIIFGFNDQQLYGDKKEDIDYRWNIKPREVLQFVGTELFRNQLGKLLPEIGENIWIASLIEKIKAMVEEYPLCSIVISDIRFQNEIDALRDFNGAHIWKIVNDRIIKKDTHSSEDIDKLKNIDSTIVNDSTLDSLYEKISFLIKNG